MANVRLWSVSLPLVFAQLAAESVFAASMLFVSQLNDTNVTAGVGLAFSFINFTTQSVLCGLN